MEAHLNKITDTLISMNAKLDKLDTGNEIAGLKKQVLEINSEVVKLRDNYSQKRVEALEVPKAKAGESSQGVALQEPAVVSTKKEQENTSSSKATSDEWLDPDEFEDEWLDPDEFFERQ